MKRSDLNFIINALMFLLMSLLIGMGLLIKYVLLPGKEVWLIYKDNVELTFLGLDRHQWGTIHLIVALVLIALLILHIILHWKQVYGIYKRIIKKKTYRSSLLIVFTILAAFFILFSFVVPIEISPHERLYKNRVHETHIEEPHSDIVKVIGDENDVVKENEHDADHEPKFKNQDINIKGFMTLNEVSSEFDVPLEYLKSELDIPDSEKGDRRLGQLIRKYEFTMIDVKDVLRKHKH